MKVTASVQNSLNEHQTNLSTNGNAYSLTIAPKPSGFGSSASGGELLFLALATCYCNDIYREAAKRNIEVESVEVTVEGEFGGAGDPATNLTYSAKVKARASEAEINELIQHTDTVAEIHNTLRVPTAIKLTRVEAIAV